MVVAHANFGGVNTAIHLIAYRGMTASYFAPQWALAQTLVHVINPASQVRAQAIEPPEPVESPLLHVPIIRRDLLHGEGLFDISRPKLDITCCSIFKPSCWVRRRLTPKEFLWVFDIPSFLIPKLLEDRQTRSLLLRSLSPLIVVSIFWSMWAVGVGVAKGSCQGIEVQISTDLQMGESREEKQGVEANIVEEVRMEDGERETKFHRLVRGWSPTTWYKLGIQEEPPSAQADLGRVCSIHQKLFYAPYCIV